MTNRFSPVHVRRLRPKKKKGPVSQCGRCLPTVQTTHNLRYSRPSPIPKTPTLILKRPSYILKRPVMCKLRPYRPRTRLCENSKNAFSHGDKRPYLLAQAFVLRILLPHAPIPNALGISFDCPSPTLLTNLTTTAAPSILIYVSLLGVRTGEQAVQRRYEQEHPASRIGIYTLPSEFIKTNLVSFSSFYKSLQLE